MTVNSGTPSAVLDLLVVGSGVAGLSAVVDAAAAAPGLRIGVVSKADLSQSATQWAQGGVAAVLDSTEAATTGPDSFDLHHADTLKAGAGLCDAAAVRILVTEGPDRLRHLAAVGARFDTDHTGVWELAREGGHSMARVVHAGGAATGAEVERALVDAARRSAAELWEGWFATDLLIHDGRCRGVRAVDAAGRVVELHATHTLLASGGAGQLFQVTTTPPSSTGDGLAMALRAGVAVADVEFMQFHPTGLHGQLSPRPLLSEAVRGEGAVLRDLSGERFVDELAPRDVVSAAMMGRMRASGAEHLWLDATGIEDFARLFPNLQRAVAAVGLDPGRDWLPVAPAAHYLCGGVVTDLDGATELPGLWAAGEVACTGVHGANRLASNSLLEGMVFGARVVEAMLGGKDHPDPSGALRGVLDEGPGPDQIGAVDLRRGRARRPVTGLPALADAAKAKERVQHAMSAGAGVLRDAASLDGAAAVLESVAAEVVEAAAGGADRSALEVANLITVGQALVSGAQARQESRGCHRRADYPDLSPHRRRYIQ